MVAGGEREFRFTPSMRRPRYRAPNRVISLFYGQDERLVVNQARRNTYSLFRGPGAPAFGLPAEYVPPRGTALLARGGHQALLRRGELVIGIVGSRPDDVGCRGAGAQPSQVMPYFSEAVA